MLIRYSDVVRRLTDSALGEVILMYAVYAIYNAEADKIYIGQTGDLKRRISEHNSVKNKGHFTFRHHGEWKLIYSESLSTRSEAIAREKQLKTSRGREFVKRYIPT